MEKVPCTWFFGVLISSHEVMNLHGYEVTSYVALWCSVYDYCRTSFNKAWTQVMHRFKSYSWHVRDLRWWGSLAVVLAGNKAKRLSSVKHTTKQVIIIIIIKSWIQREWRHTRECTKHFTPGFLCLFLLILWKKELFTALWSFWLFLMNLWSCKVLND